MSADDSEEEPSNENIATTPDLDDLDDEDLEEVADEVAEDTSDDQKDEGDQSDPQKTPGDSTPDDLQDDLSVGHVYCQTLGVSAAVLVDRYGEAESGRDDLVDEYADLAKQTDLDHYMDQWFQEQMGESQMSPGQGLVVGTVLFGVLVLANNPEVADALAEEIDAV